MAPPKEACKLYVDILDTKSKLIQAVMDVKDAVRKLSEIRGKIRFGIINLADVIGAETIAAISSISATIATSIFGAASKAVSNVLNLIISQILKIVLAYPTAIFSLVAIPHEQAILSAGMERRSLLKARENLRTVLQIMSKWLRSVSAVDYYAQIKNAIPYIEAAIREASSIMKGLEGDSDDGRNATFSEGSYNKLRSLIATAIQITKPQSVVVNTLKINQSIEADRKRIYGNKKVVIDKKYRELKVSTDEEYQAKLAKAYERNSRIEYAIDSRTTSNEDDSKIKKVAKSIHESKLKETQSMGFAIQIEELKLEWSARISVLENEHSTRLSVAEMEASKEAALNTQRWLDGFNNVQISFVFDMNLVGKNLSELVSNIGKAYSYNKMCQLQCAVIYDIRGYIARLINEVISMLRATSNRAADLMLGPMRTVRSMLEVADEKFVAAADKYEDKAKKISSAEMSATVSLGHGLLLASDATLSGSINKALINLINSDDVLQDSNNKFDRFTKRLYDIPDWDGKTGVWCVSLLNSAQSSYVKTVIDCTSALSQTMVLSVSNDPDDKIRIGKLLRTIEASFSTLLTHNGIVYSALASYTPYMSSEAGDLKRILTGAGLLNTFVTTMSVIELVSDLAVTISEPFDTEMVSIKNCQAAYADLFKNKKTSLAAAMDKQNVPAVLSDLKYQGKLEENEIEIEKLRKDITYFAPEYEEVKRDDKT